MINTASVNGNNQANLYTKNAHCGFKGSLTIKWKWYGGWLDANVGVDGHSNWPINGKFDSYIPLCWSRHDNNPPKFDNNPPKFKYMKGEPRHEKTCLQGFRPGKTKTGLLS